MNFIEYLMTFKNFFLCELMQLTDVNSPITEAPDLFVH